MREILQASRNMSMRNFIAMRRQIKFVKCGIAIILCISSLTQIFAQPVIDTIELTEEDAIKLGIQFKPARPIDESMGIELPGQIIAPPHEGSHAYSIVDGVLSEWKANSGDPVSKGEIIARIASSMASEIQAQWLDAYASLSYARLEARRSERLFNKGVIAQRSLQQVQLALAHAESREAASRKAFERLGFDAFSIDGFAETQADLGYALLRAPRDGILVHRARSAGEPVEVGDSLAEFQSGSAKWISAILPAALINTLGAGTKLSVKETGERLTLRERDYSVDSLTQTIELFAEFNTEVSYPLGSLLDVFLLPNESGVLVPASAIVFTEGKNFVYVKTADGVIPRQLELIPVGRDYVARAGLRVDEEIAVSGTALLKGMQLGLGGDC